MESPKADVLLEHLREYVQEQGKLYIYGSALQSSACKLETDFTLSDCFAASLPPNCSEPACVSHKGICSSFLSSAYM